MVENEKALSKDELETLYLIRDNNLKYITSQKLYGYYKFDDSHDWDRVLSKLKSLDFVSVLYDFPASHEEPAYLITQPGREYLQIQDHFKEKNKKAKQDQKVEMEKWVANLIFGVIGAVLASLLSIFQPEIRTFFGLM